MGDVASIIARLGLDARPFQAGLKDSLRYADQFGSSLLRIPNLGGILSAAGIGAVSHEILELADRTQALSERFGVNTTILQQWGHVAEVNNSSTEALASAFNKLDVARSKALAGDESMLAHFVRLGVTLTDLEKLSPDELMKKIGQGSLDAASRVAVLGKNSGELLTTLQSVGNGTAKFGIALSEIDVEKLAEANKLFKELGQHVAVTTASVLALALKDAKNFKDEITEVGKKLAAVFTANTPAEIFKAEKEFLAVMKDEILDRPVGRKGQGGTFGPTLEEMGATDAAKKKAAMDDDELNKLDEKVHKAQGMSAVLRLQLAGESELARALQTQLEFEEKIAEAKRIGSAATVKELELQRQLTLQKQAQELDTKKLEQVQLSLQDLAEHGRRFAPGNDTVTGAGEMARQALREIELARQSSLNENIPEALRHRARAQDIENRIPTLKESEKDRNPIDTSTVIRDLANTVGAIERNTANIWGY